VSNSLSSNSALDLYAKVEDLLGIKEASPKLYAHYLLFLNSIEFDSILDIGCGSGDFLLEMSNSFNPSRVLGIDLSEKMVEMSISKGIDARAIDISRVDESFDVVTAVFDMLNYLDRSELKRLLRSIESKINPDGYLICDINTLYGFEDIAVGSFIVDDGDRFLTIDSEFENDIYRSDFTLFEREKNGLFIKSQEIIEQRYHRVREIDEMVADMRLLIDDDVKIYGNRADKRFLVFQKGR